MLQNYSVPFVFYADEASHSLPAYIGGTLKAPLITYEDWPHEAVQYAKPVYINGTLAAPLVSYTNWPHEDVDYGKPVYVNGTLVTALIQYTNWPVLIADEDVHFTSHVIYINGTLV